MVMSELAHQLFRALIPFLEIHAYHNLSHPLISKDGDLGNV